MEESNSKTASEDCRDLTCSGCQTQLPADAPAGLCPACLLTAAILNSDSEQPADRFHSPTTPGPNHLQPPEVALLAPLFPQLEVLSLLGVGGMGMVYKARQRKLDRNVALKIIRPDAAADPAFAERFSREAKALARLNHSRIVSIHDFGDVPAIAQAGHADQSPMYFLVMEFVDGVNLRQLLDDGGLSPQLVLSIIPQICEALQFAHDEGIVHRDIKPENILIDARGRVKIADFGLAKLLADSGRADHFTLTGTHQIMGTPRYMAPEQMERSGTVDHRADIYSLGVVFYEMLTGQIPAGHFEPPSIKAEMTTAVDEIILKSLARDPARRFQRADQLQHLVESLTPKTVREPTDSACRDSLGNNPGPRNDFAATSTSTPLRRQPSAGGLSSLFSREAASLRRWLTGGQTSAEVHVGHPGSVKSGDPVAAAPRGLQTLLIAGCCGLMLLPWWQISVPDTEVVRGFATEQLGRTEGGLPARIVMAAPLEFLTGCSSAILTLLAAVVAAFGIGRPSSSRVGVWISVVLIGVALALLFLHRLELGRMTFRVLGDPVTKSPPLHYFENHNEIGTAWLYTLDHKVTLRPAAWAGFTLLFGALLMSIAELRFAGPSAEPPSVRGVGSCAAPSPGFAWGWFFCGLLLLLSTFGLILFTLYFTGSVWTLTSLFVLWFVIGGCGETFSKHPSASAVYCLILLAILPSLGLVAYSIWLSQSAWPLVYVPFAAYGMLGGASTFGDSDDESTDKP